MDLSNFINNLALLDVDLLGGIYTWSNKRIGSDCIQVWLDRALISLNWLNSFSCKLSILPRVRSDHSPISLSQLSLLNLGGTTLFGLRRCGLPILIY